MSEQQTDVTRRRLFQVLAGLGIGTPIFQRALAAKAQEVKGVTAAMIKDAEWIAGLKLTDDQRKITAALVNRALRDFSSMQNVKLDNAVAPLLVFNPQPWVNPAEQQRTGTVELTEWNAPKKPESDNDLAFLPVTELATLIRNRTISSVELTKLYLKRLKQFDPVLRCVVNYTEALALEQAARADREIAAGNYRGPLHGIPWGAKDLIAHPAAKTTWGALHLKNQQLDVKATVAQRLEDAGAVLVAKLSLGALAMGDKWFGGMTRSPWDPKRGSSGSSAGSASSTAAGLVGFTLGSETLGSIVSPSRRCGTSGLRPTFGRVSRHGCMALTWSMDKIGPIARSIEDCALVFGAIHGWDGLDAAAVDRPFSWPLKKGIRGLRVGYVGEENRKEELRVLKDLGVKLVPIKLPEEMPISALRQILYTEAATIFDDVTRENLSEGLNSWPALFRAGQFVPAVEYLRANRIRALLMQEMEKLMQTVDLYVGGDDLLITNLTGHPTIVMPNGFSKQGGVEQPRSITFTGRLYGETELLAVGHAWQQATGHHLKHPDVKKLLQGD